MKLKLETLSKQLYFIFVISLNSYTQLESVLGLSLAEFTDFILCP